MKHNNVSRNIYFSQLIFPASVPPTALLLLLINLISFDRCRSNPNIKTGSSGTAVHLGKSSFIYMTLNI